MTACGGLTREELKQILDQQREFLVEARASEIASGKRAELQAMVKEVNALLPQVREVAGASAFGTDSVRKAEQSLAAAARALGGDDLAAISESLDQMTRTAALFRSVAERSGSRRQ